MRDSVYIQYNMFFLFAAIIIIQITQYHNIDNRLKCCTCIDFIYTGMDNTSLDTSSGSLFVRMSQDVHVTSNVITYHCSAWLRTIVRLGTIERRLTLLRNITSDCYLNISFHNV